jgi:hypothetical protein
MNNEQDKLSSKSYEKFQRVFMPFGSLMNSLQGQLTPQNWKEIAEAVFQWCVEKVDDRLDKLYVEDYVGEAEDKPEPFKQCPVCKKPMMYVGGIKTHPKAPDWKCSDKACK